MSLLSTVDALIAAGGSVEQIRAVVAAHHQAEEDRRATRREGAAERQRKSRLSRMSRVTERDTLSPDKEAPHTPKEINPSPGRCAAPARTREDLDRIEDACRDAAGAQRDRNASPGLFDLRPILAWLDAGFSLEEDILPVIRAKAPRNLGSWAYFAGALRDALDASHRAVSAAREAARPPRSVAGCGRPVFDTRNGLMNGLLAMDDEEEFHG